MSNVGGYTTKQILAAFGLKRDRFMNWVGEGYISASIPQVGGRHPGHLWTKEDIVLLAAFLALFRMGFNRSKAAKIANTWDKTSPVHIHKEGDIEVSIDFAAVMAAVEKELKVV